MMLAPADMDTDELRVRIRKLRETGHIPCDEAEKTWAGNGQARPCSGCGVPIQKNEVEYEVDLRSGVTLRLHRRCHIIWMEECAQHDR
jgi:hypothetical protein